MGEEMNSKYGKLEYADVRVKITDLLFMMYKLKLIYAGIMTYEFMIRMMKTWENK